MRISSRPVADGRHDSEGTKAPRRDRFSFVPDVFEEPEHGEKQRDRRALRRGGAEDLPRRGAPVACALASHREAGFQGSAMVTRAERTGGAKNNACKTVSSA